MFPAFFQYWGKARPESPDGPQYHLLPYHCLDVAAVSWHLIDYREKQCIGLAHHLSVEPRWLQRWFTFCLLLHDLGKFARSFQMLVPNLSPMLVPAVGGCVYSERHDTLGFLLWRNVLSQRLADIFPASCRRAMECWLEIVCGHHGQPPKKSCRSLRSCFVDADEDAAEAYVREISKQWMPNLEPLPHINPQKLKSVSWQLAGIAVLADWLGSGQVEFKYHDYRKETSLTEYWHDIALPAAERVLQKAEFQNKATAHFESIRQLFPFILHPTPLQTFAETVPLADGPQLFLLEDVTGAGKTEAAMVLVHRLMSAGLAEGLYVGLPTMATANAMYERLAESYAALYRTDTSASLVLAHGVRELSGTFQESVGLAGQPFDLDYSKNENSASAYCNAWLADNRKKALLSDVGVGTLDQALLGVLPARHQSLRLLGLSGKILLVDEVHAYDPYMLRLLTALLEAHARQGGSAILLSATLPELCRRQLLAGFAKGIDVAEPQITQAGYPMVTHFTATGLSETAIETRSKLKRRVVVNCLDNEAQVLQIIKQAVDQGQCVCWVRNTVKDARRTYQALEQAEWVDQKKLTLFHSRFAMIDRQTIEKDVLRRFGKRSTAEARKGQILIATQVIEQSLDLDFDQMISDLAPVDLMIQRAGRLQRHARDADGNPFGQESVVDKRGPTVFYLHAPDSTNVKNSGWLKDSLPGTQAVYPHAGQLWLTADILLNDRGFSMPEDARHLIEGVYGADAQERIPECLLEASWAASGEQKSQRGMAEFNRLKLEKGYTRASAEDSGGWDEEVHIPTRLSGNSVTVALVVVEDGKLVPYANTERHAWTLSQLSVPEGEWRRAQKQIPQAWQTAIEQLKATQPILKWVDIWPLEKCSDHMYSKKTGWGGDLDGVRGG